MILLIDNYDSLVHNLARYFRLLGESTQVVRNDQIHVSDIRSLRPTAIVLSPGPCAPAQAGESLTIVRDLHQEFPLLGICLGHQVIAEAFGGQIVRASEPVHGQSSWIFHDQAPPFEQVPVPFQGARYHSLVAERATLPESLEVTAWLEDGTIMGLRHRRLPIIGWQFHPESILTPPGLDLLRSVLHWFHVVDQAQNHQPDDL